MTAPEAAGPANLSHFAVNADDVEASRRFYEATFGWRFTAWGPPGFYQIRTGTDADPGVQGAMQQRRDLLPGTRTIGLECTFGVPDLAATERAALANGGHLAMARSTIPGVGHLLFLADPAGNILGAIQPDPHAE